MASATSNEIMVKFDRLFPGFHERYVLPADVCQHCARLILDEWDWSVKTGAPLRLKHQTEPGYKEILTCVSRSRKGSLRYSVDGFVVQE